MAVDDATLERILARLPEREWAAITTADLADASGLSRMTLHRRGITKDEVLERLGEQLRADYREALFEPLTGEGSARDRLRRALAALCDVDERYLPVLGALSTQLEPIFHEPGEEDEPVLTRPAFTGALRRLLEDGAHDGTVVVRDPVETATLLFNAVGHTYRHMRTGHRWPPVLARERVVDLILDGLPR